MSVRAPRTHAGSSTERRCVTVTVVGVWACLCVCWRACKKCAQTPILLIPLSPHYLYHPQSAPLTSSWRLQKVCTNPYFIDSTFLSLFIPYWLDTTPSRWPLGNGTRPRLDPHKARPHRFSRRGRWPRARARRTWALGLGLRAVGVSARARADPCGAGASRVGVERLEPTPSRIILHLRRLSVAVLAEGAVSTACPRHTAGPARPHRLRSVRHAMRQPGAVGRCGATQGCTQAVSACSTPATCLAKSRQSARLCAAAQGHAPSHRLQSTRNATRRPSGAVQCGAAVLGHRVWWRPSPKGAHELHRLRMRLELRRHPRHGGTSLLVTTSERCDPPASMEPVSHRNGAAASPHALGRHDAPQRPEPPPASACCWYLCRG